MIVPSDEISRLPSTVKVLFLRWTDFMYSRVRFNMPDSELHAAAHCERVLLFGLLIGEKQFPDNSTAWEILAHASVFHDTRRFDEYLDTGHGARAAAYYRDFCGNTTDICYHPEAEYLMRYHDRNDNIGNTAIENAFGDDSTQVLQLYDVFKDADALDRWRLGRYGIDVRYLRTDNARHLLDFAKRIVEETVPKELIRHIEQLIIEQLNSQER